MDYRTDLAMERTVRPGGMGAGVSVHTQQQAGAEVLSDWLQTPLF